MKWVNQAWHTKDDHVFTLCFKLTQEQLEKENERDENIKNMLYQIDILQEHMNGASEVFQVGEGSSTGYLRSGGVKVGTPKGIKKVSTYAINNGVESRFELL